MLQKQRLCCNIILHDISTSNSRLVYNTDILDFMNGSVASHPQLPASYAIVTSYNPLRKHGNNHYKVLYTR